MATQTSPNINAERIKGHLQLSASTTASAQLNLIAGTAPTSPAAGDIYRDSSRIVVVDNLAISSAGLGAFRIGNVANTNARDMSIYRNANGVVGIAIENNTAGATSRVNINFGNSSTNGFGNADISRYDYSFSGNYGGSSIAVSDTLSVGNYVGTGGALGQSNIVFKDSSVITISGTTATNYGTRLDANGLRIGQLSTLHTSNTRAFQVYDITAVSGNILYGGTGDQSFIQIDTSIAQIGHYSTRAQYTQLLLVEYVHGAETMRSTESLTTFATAMKLDDLAGTGSRVLEADADGNITATTASGTITGAAKLFVYYNFT